MKAIFASASTALLSSLVIGHVALAAPDANYQLTCTPAGSAATATFVVVIDANKDASSSTGLSGTALMNLSLQAADGSAPVSEQNIEVRGQIEQAVDSQGNHPYQVLFAQPVQTGTGITYARVAIGDNEVSALPNSYIRDAKGVYYYAHCQDPTRRF